MILMPYAITVMPEGDKKKYMERLYKQYVRLMYEVAWRYSKDAATVDDIVSDAVLSLIQKIDTLMEMKPVKIPSYIAKAVKNTALNHFDKMKRRNGHIVHLDVETVRAVADRLNIEDKIVLEEELNLVMAMIDSLPEKEQKIMHMKYDLELPDDIIAAEVDLAASSIPKYVSRARERIRSNLYQG